MKTMKWTAWLMSAVMCGAAVSGFAARPNIPEQPNFLESTVPETFGGWRKLKEPAQIVDPATEEILKKIYREVLSRTYVNEAGDRVMLSMARSGNQIGIQSAHIPEVCYPAQGFQVTANDQGTLPVNNTLLPVKRLQTNLQHQRFEPITYWTTVGDHVVTNKIDKKLVEIRYGFNGVIPDGLLFRVSSIDSDTANAFRLQDEFVRALAASLDSNGRLRLMGMTR